MKATLVQMNSQNDKTANIAQARELIDRAVVEESPDLVVLPEHFDILGTVEEKLAAGEDLPGGPAYEMCRQAAIEHKVNIHAGSLAERIPGEDRNFNTTVAFDRQGNELVRYRKIHMFDIVSPTGEEYRESAATKPGSSVETYDLEGIRIGCAVCYDLRFPELFRSLMLKGAQVIVLPAAFTLQTGKDHWEVLCRARAIETESYFLAAAQALGYPMNGETRYSYGHSLIVDPWGHVVAKASDGVGLVSARLDIGLADKVRAAIPLKSHFVLETGHAVK